MLLHMALDGCFESGDLSLELLGHETGFLEVTDDSGEFLSGHVVTSFVLFVGEK